MMLMLDNDASVTVIVIVIVIYDALASFSGGSCQFFQKKK